MIVLIYAKIKLRQPVSYFIGRRNTKFKIGVNYLILLHLIGDIYRMYIYIHN